MFLSEQSFISIFVIGNSAKLDKGTAIPITKFKRNKSSFVRKEIPICDSYHVCVSVGG